MTIRQYVDTSFLGTCHKAILFYFSLTKDLGLEISLFFMFGYLSSGFNSLWVLFFLLLLTIFFLAYFAFTYQLMLKNHLLARTIYLTQLNLIALSCPTLIFIVLRTFNKTLCDRIKIEKVSLVKFILYLLSPLKHHNIVVDNNNFEKFGKSRSLLLFWGQNEMEICSTKMAFSAPGLERTMHEDFRY